MSAAGGHAEETSPKTRIPKTASSVHDVSAEKPPFGSRFLTNEADVWSQNAWDHVPPPTDQDEVISAALNRQKSAPVPDEEKPKYNDKPARHWDEFYKANASNFFRNRKWLHLEFPELKAAAEAHAGPMVIAEVGCGAGNAVFPLLAANENPHLHLKAYDYSSHAVKLVQNNPLYLSPPLGTIEAAVWDLTSPTLPPGLEPGSVDILTLVFVMSALHPKEWANAVSNIHKLLKPGGLVLMRDYGRYDLTQLRFKGGRLLDDNFYIRGDKTRVYFFELDELALLFTGSPAPAASKTSTAIQVVEEADDPSDSDPSTRSAPGISQPQSPGQSTPTLADVEESLSSLSVGTSEDTPQKAGAVHPTLAQPSTTNGSHPLFSIEQLGVDRRLIVNRKRQLKMYRVWMQGKFRKASEPESKS
ncbi:methyltransferase [Trametes versicolor FP-101664 SS1]|uniref:methyltransferase n=1 Tax=Trametes versicolor (strain FP-101664) TaxID=717944 RepID=UPI0004622535|nr:methyltransferase [Trametes versicolor FP-101664 SS1]EIW59850.1 methyltransferase [Trametes versicolor FP-101664 SS1]